MSAFTENIKAHYAGLPMGTVEVPEWGLTLYVRPATIGQSATILKEKDQFRQACRLIQIRGKKDDGCSVFDEQDYEAMVSHGEITVINRLVDEIMALGDLEDGEAKKP